MYDSTFRYTNEWLRDRPTSYLKDLAEGARKKMLELRSISVYRKGLTPNVSPHLMKKIKKDVARLLTIIRERE